ncbi:MAG: alpha/beta fold hydrolase [bacterium]
MDRYHVPSRPDRAPVRAHDRDHLSVSLGGDEARLAGRLDPAEMFPAGSAHIRTRHVTLPSGLTLRIAESGEPGRPVVLLIHGWGASLYMWRAWYASLADAGRHVIAVDLPGHGLSDKPDAREVYRLDSLVGVLKALLDVERVQSVDVVAQSMAGTIAIHLATHADLRVNRTVVVNPACFGRVRLQRFARLVSPRIVDVILPRLVARSIVARTHRMVYGDPSRITGRDEDEYWAPSQFPGYARAMRRLLHEFSWKRPPAAEMSARLKTLTREMLVVLGSADALVRDALPYVTALRAAGAPLDVRVVSGGGHAVNEERPEEVVAMVLKFLE